MYQNFIIWGAGYYGTRIERLISKEPEHKILAFCDSNTELVGKRIDQYDVVSIEKAVEMCRQDSRLVIVIGIFNYDVIKEVKQAALKYFPQHTKVITGHDIQDAIENKFLQKYHEHMEFRWKVELEKYFFFFFDNIMSEVEYWIKNVADIQGKNHGYYVRCRENERFTHAMIAEVAKPNEVVLDIGCGLLTMP